MTDDPFQHFQKRWEYLKKHGPPVCARCGERAVALTPTGEDLCREHIEQFVTESPDQDPEGRSDA